MPELPEVETTRRGIVARLRGRRISRVAVRHWHLRWPVARQVQTRLPGRHIRDIARRAKYLLLETDAGTLIVHLGMSGRLRLVPPGEPPGPHDHLDLVVDDDLCLRLTDPRRFGAVLWCRGDVHRHRLLRELGPEPLEPEFDGDYLYRRSRNRRVAIKNFIMNARVVAGNREHLRQRGAAPGGSASAARRRADLPVPLPAPRGVHSAGAAGGDRGGGHHLARLRRRRRNAGALRVAAAGLRAGGRALPALPHAPAPAPHRPARDLVLPRLPALSDAHKHLSIAAMSSSTIHSLPSRENLMNPLPANLASSRWKVRVVTPPHVARTY